MIVLTTDISKFKSECHNIYMFNSQIKSVDIQHEMMLNERFKENLCVELLRRYGIFACSDRWLITDELLKSHLSCIVDFGNVEEYSIQDYKSYFSRVSVLRDKVFNTCEDFCNYMESNQVDVKSSYTMKDFDTLNVLKILRDTGGFVMPSIEKSIRIAMKELGIDMSESDEFETDSSDENTEEGTTEEVVESEPIIEEDDTTEVEPEGDSKPAVYMKVKGDSVALIFDSNIKFQSRELGGQSMNVLSFKMPDVNSEKLQELELIIEESKNEPEKETKKSEVVKKSIKRTPVVTNDYEVEPSDEITELKNQKAALDSQIKEARSEGNTELVNSLRKQRRAIRNKINSIGG